MNKPARRLTQAYNEQVDALFRFSHAHVSDREEAMDLVQETFTKTWKYMVGGGRIRNLKAWLYQTLRHVIIDYYRKKKSLSLDSLHEMQGFDPPAPADLSPETRIDGALALRLLDRLPSEYKEVVVLRYVNELSYHEIAAITGESENAVTVRCHRALKKMRQIFNHEK